MVFLEESLKKNDICIICINDCWCVQRNGRVVDDDGMQKKSDHRKCKAERANKHVESAIN